MSDDRELVEAATDELKDQVDVADLVTGDSITDQVDGASLGRSLGGVLGAILGRRLGRTVGRALRSKILRRSDDDEDRSSFGRLVNAVLVAFVRTFQKPKFREPVEDALRKFAESREERLTESKESVEEVETETEEAAEDAASETKEAAEDVAGADLDAAELQALKSETYRDLLEMMEYSQIQSIAKEVGVKANLGREEMVDRIVEQFDETSDESGDGDETSDESGDGEEPDANGAETDEPDQ